jgi:predicted kinase
MGGATGMGLVMLAHHLVRSGAARRILVVAGENRMTGQSRDSVVQVLAQVGHPVYEVPLGASIPAYYGLVASRYMHAFGNSERDFAALAVLMREHASGTRARSSARRSPRTRCWLRAPSPRRSSCSIAAPPPTAPAPWSSRPSPAAQRGAHPRRRAAPQRAAHQRHGTT